jgi:hypothetical protein
MNESLGDTFPDGNTTYGFVTTEYVPSDFATWELVKIDGVNYLRLFEVFPMYGINPATVLEGGDYEIITMSPNLLHIKYVADNGEWTPAWHFYLVPADGSNIKNITQSQPLTAWTQNGILHISGLIAGEQWSVYNVSGILVGRGVPLRSPYQESEVTTIMLPASGIYIVKAGNRTVKVKN